MGVAPKGKRDPRFPVMAEAMDTSEPQGEPQAEPQGEPQAEPEPKPKLLRREVWLAVQRERVQCPQCMRVMTRRILRWRHVCQDRGPLKLTSEQADQLREKLDEKAFNALEKRLETNPVPQRLQPRRPPKQQPLKHQPLPLKESSAESGATGSPSS